MVVFYNKVFETLSIPSHLNGILICLIPKVKNANHLKSFCPISLYNTIYKVITKIIV